MQTSKKYPILARHIFRQTPAGQPLMKLFPKRVFDSLADLELNGRNYKNDGWVVVDTWQKRKREKLLTPNIAENERNADLLQGENEAKQGLRNDTGGLGQIDPKIQSHVGENQKSFEQKLEDFRASESGGPFKQGTGGQGTGGQGTGGQGTGGQGTQTEKELKERAEKAEAELAEIKKQKEQEEEKKQRAAQKRAETRKKNKEKAEAKKADALLK